MKSGQFYCGGKLHNISFQRMQTVKRSTARRRRGSGALSRGAMASAIETTIKAQASRLQTRIAMIREDHVHLAPTHAGTGFVIGTESIVLDGATKAEVRRAVSHYGFTVVDEGRFGKVLLQAPADAEDGVQQAFQVALEIHKRGKVKAAHPNFLRAIPRPRASTGAGSGRQWGLDNDAQPGLTGADVHAWAAWTMTVGDPDIRVAVLDEGVDTKHPDLKAVVVADADFVDGNPTSQPDRDDAHGTACAGIISSQSNTVWGLAAGCSLVGVRIAKSDAQGYWIFDDFKTADAIDWSWDDAKADVLSNSWGGGPAVDVITRAFGRAQTRGRGGRGAIVAVAAGNDQTLVDYPGNLAGVLTVGASNEWDERKTKTSKDGEHWWGSNYGPPMDVMAPGVHIPTTDIRGARGYAGGKFTDNFNGTSSACPHAAAVAALMLSVNPKLREDRVREIINETADPLQGQKKWNPKTGHGRLNAFRAVWQARRG